MRSPLFLASLLFVSLSAEAGPLGKLKSEMRVTLDKEKAVEWVKKNASQRTEMKFPSAVAPGSKVFLALALFGQIPKDQDPFELKVGVKLIPPSGEATEATILMKTEQIPGFLDRHFLAPVFDVTFTPNDPIGKYRFEVTMLDPKTGENLKLNREVQLVTQKMAKDRQLPKVEKKDELAEIDAEEMLKLRDPFKQPPILVERVIPKTELEQFPVDQFRLIGVISGPIKHRAMIRDPQGKTHYVVEHMRIGMRNGTISKILPTGMIINEKIVNVLGLEEDVRTVLKLSDRVVSQVLEKK